MKYKTYLGLNRNGNSDLMQTSLIILKKGFLYCELSRLTHDVGGQIMIIHNSAARVNLFLVITFAQQHNAQIKDNSQLRMIRTGDVSLYGN